MPIYEFYCAPCHTVFSFLARTTGRFKRPGCPRCKRDGLERRASAFAISSGRPHRESDADELPEGFDEARFEKVMAEMAEQVEHVSEDDPRQMAHVMRRLFDGAGMRLGPGMEEAIRRMEAGEDPDRIEEELGDQLEGAEDELFSAEPGGSGRLRRLRRRLAPPDVDPTLYEL